jgi:hypothetical protein
MLYVIFTQQVHMSRGEGPNLPVVRHRRLGALLRQFRKVTGRWVCRRRAPVVASEDQPPGDQLAIAKVMRITLHIVVR